LTRAFAHLAKGEWTAALAAHPLAPVLALELGVLWGGWGARLAGRPVLGGQVLRGPVAPATPAGSSPNWTVPLVLGNLAVLWALWLGRAATGTLPW
jgi:hypothetical protein